MNTTLRVMAAGWIVKLTVHSVMQVGKRILNENAGTKSNSVVFVSVSWRIRGRLRLMLLGFRMAIGSGGLQMLLVPAKDW